MAQAANNELVERFEQFFRDYYRDDIGELAREFPTDRRSLYVDWQDLYRFDPDLADDYLSHPEDFREKAEEALRLYDLPVDVKLGGAHVRVCNLPESTDIRALRSQHVNQLIAVNGLVRKATDVKPKIQNAAFECQRCGTLTRIPQSGADFHEPHECDGCERQGPFQLNVDQSEFVDSQSLRIQESPEGLQGGETPRSIDVRIEDDLTGEVTPGDHVEVTGVLRIDQSGDGQDSSPVFDTYMEGVAVQIEDEQFEDMEITDEDKKEIFRLSESEDIYEQMVESIAPSIYGYDQQKLAMALQLFSGVTKHLPDGTRLRGDLHILFIGDPGTGKSQMLQYIQMISPRSVYTSGKGSSSAGLCVTGDTLVHTADGFRRIDALAKEEHPTPVESETSAPFERDLYTYDRSSGEVERRSSSRVWRMPEKPCRQIETAHGKRLEASTNTPVLTCGEDGIQWTPIAEVDPGDHVAVPRYDDADLDRQEVPVRELLELTEEKVDLSPDAVEFLQEQLREEFGTLREAATELDLSEPFVYYSLPDRHVPLDKLDRILDAVGASREAVGFDRTMLRHGHSVAIPETFDEELLYLLGLVFGDGDIAIDRRDGNRGMVRISNGDESVLRRAADVFASKFDVCPEVERQEDRVPYIRVHSATIARLFHEAGMRTPKEELALDPRLTTAAHADAFLRGLMDADGAVSERDSGGSSVLLSTISERLARQVQLMLETYGVRANVRERDRRGTYELDDGRTVESKHVQYFVEIYGVDVDRYADEIGFGVASKQDALESIATDGGRRGDTLPVGDALTSVDTVAGQYHTNVVRGDNPGRERARAMLDDRDLKGADPLVREAVEADLRWDEVVEATDTGRKEVFDLTVPGTHNFLGNGLVTHNTAAAVKDDFGDGQQWSLEAGALVLADQGIAAVDELDKMRCVTGDTLVQCGDGGVRRIREIAEAAAESGTIEPLENGRTIRDTDLDVYTMADDGRIVRRPVTAVHEYDAPDDLREVTLESGETVTATADHPFFVLQDGERTERATEDLEKGDWVYVPRKIPSVEADGGAVAVERTEEPSDEALTPAHGAVLGYITGDGNVFYDRDQGCYGIRFTNSEEELLEDFERACREAFDAEPSRPPSERRDDGVETVRLTGKEYVDELLEFGLNLETYDGKRVPEGVTAAPRETKAAFVRALADSEGHVDGQKVSIFSSSYDLLLGTKAVLLEFGITTQIHEKTDDGRDLYELVVTSDRSLAAFDEHVGSTLDRKQAALGATCEATDGDRTILDVIPDCGDIFRETRESLRLYQRECGLNAGTYCDFENGNANVSLHRAETVLNRFERRKRRGSRDMDALASTSSWDVLEEMKQRYHVSQAELAEGTDASQWRISTEWGEDPDLRSTMRGRLREIVRSVTETDLYRLRELVRGGVKWRRVETVESADPPTSDDRIPILEARIADSLELYDATDVLDRARELLDRNRNPETFEELRAELDAWAIPFADVADEMDVDPSTVSRWFSGTVQTDDFDALRETCLELIGQKRSKLETRLEEIRRRREPKVYDLTVEETHNFVANGAIIHNSEDRSAMHQALEQQEISISKAGINATLKSRCSLLGAANPKYGRFDQYEPIGEQIDLEPALISRFDLIFTVTDEPDEEEDRRLAEHILTTNYAGELNTQREEMTSPDVSREEVESYTDEVDPAIDPDLFRKYVAYAKQDCHPRMTEEARETIQEFYTDLRAKGTDEDAPVPVTARKLEAIVRLAEASARVRLSDQVTQADAKRVIDIVRSCLQDVGVDPESGEFDADVVETGTSKSQRDRIKNIKTLIEDVEEEYEDGAPVDVVLDRADEIGMDRSKAEHEIESLKQKGEVYEPSTDHLRTT